MKLVLEWNGERIVIEHPDESKETALKALRKMGYRVRNEGCPKYLENKL